LRRLVTASTFFFIAAFARAQGGAQWDGQWKQSALKEDYTVQQWLPGCGPAPMSHSSGGGETITITQEGDELSFVGGGRVYKSNQCYDDMPTLARESHSRDPSGKIWRTHCATPAGDPRRATMNTLVQVASDGHIDLAETGRYEITLTDGKCTADVKRTRGYDLVKSATPVASAVSSATATATATATAKVCDHVGDPARLEVRPSRKLMKTGDTFSFNAIVLDANGCATGTKTTWTVESGSGVTVDPAGLVTVAADAAEGNATIVATAAGKSAKVTVDVSSPAHYADLLASSGLNSSGESDVASTAVIASSSLGTQDAHADDSRRALRRNMFIAVVGGLTLVLAIVALVGWRRSKKVTALAREAEERHQERMDEYEQRQKKRTDDHAAQQRAHDESVKRAEAVKAKRGATGAMECPSCRREYPAASQFCPHDGSKLQPQSGASAPLGNICPVCKRGYDAQTKVCPADGEELVPQAAFRATVQQTAVKPRGKICPTCGGRFEGEAVFCGKDGTALVLLN
jgi:Rieske Fe-S protein